MPAVMPPPQGMATGSFQQMTNDGLAQIGRAGRVNTFGSVAIIQTSCVVGSIPAFVTGCCLMRGSLPSIKHLIQERSFLYSGSVESLTRANCNDRLMMIHRVALSGCVAVA